MANNRNPTSSPTHKPHTHTHTQHKHTHTHTNQNHHRRHQQVPADPLAARRRRRRLPVVRAAVRQQGDRRPLHAPRLPAVHAHDVRVRRALVRQEPRRVPRGVLLAGAARGGPQAVRGVLHCTGCCCMLHAAAAACCCRCRRRGPALGWSGRDTRTRKQNTQRYTQPKTTHKHANYTPTSQHNQRYTKH